MNIFQKWTLLAALPMALLLTSCEDVIDLDTGFNQSQLAVDGWVRTDTTVQTVRLTRTQQYFDANNPKGISNATVVLTDDAGRTDTLREVAGSPGEYIAANWRGELGRTYNLYIKSEGEEYEASDVVRRNTVIDSLKSERREASLGQDEGYYLLFYASDLPGTGDAYRFVVFRNGVPYNRPTQIIVANDLSTDGLPFIPPIRNQLTLEPYALYDTIAVEVRSLSPAAYRFFNEASTQSNNVGLFARPIANIYTNVRNRRQGGPAAIGFFGASAVTRKELVILPTP